MLIDSGGGNIISTNSFSDDNSNSMLPKSQKFSFKSNLSNLPNTSNFSSFSIDNKENFSINKNVPLSKNDLIVQSNSMSIVGDKFSNVPFYKKASDFISSSLNSLKNKTLHGGSKVLEGIQYGGLRALTGIKDGVSYGFNKSWSGIKGGVSGVYDYGSSKANQIKESVNDYIALRQINKNEELMKYYTKELSRLVDLLNEQKKNYQTRSANKHLENYKEDLKKISSDVDNAVAPGIMTSQLNTNLKVTSEDLKKKKSNFVSKKYSLERNLNKLRQVMEVQKKSGEILKQIGHNFKKIDNKKIQKNEENKALIKGTEALLDVEVPDENPEEYNNALDYLASLKQEELEDIEDEIEKIMEKKNKKKKRRNKGEKVGENVFYINTGSSSSGNPISDYSNLNSSVSGMSSMANFAGSALSSAIGIPNVNNVSDYIGKGSSMAVGGYIGNKIGGMVGNPLIGTALGAHLGTDGIINVSRDFGESVAPKKLSNSTKAILGIGAIAGLASLYNYLYPREEKNYYQMFTDYFKKDESFIDKVYNLKNDNANGFAPLSYVDSIKRKIDDVYSNISKNISYLNINNEIKQEYHDKEIIYNKLPITQKNDFLNTLPVLHKDNKVNVEEKLVKKEFIDLDFENNKVDKKTLPSFNNLPILYKSFSKDNIKRNNNISDKIPLLNTLPVLHKDNKIDIEEKLVKNEFIDLDIENNKIVEKIPPFFNNLPILYNFVNNNEQVDTRKIINKINETKERDYNKLIDDTFYKSANKSDFLTFAKDDIKRINNISDKIPVLNKNTQFINNLPILYNPKRDVKDFENFSKFYNKIWFTPSNFVNFAKDDIYEANKNRLNNFYLNMFDFDIKNDEINKKNKEYKEYKEKINNDLLKLRENENDNLKIRASNIRDINNLKNNYFVNNLPVLYNPKRDVKDFENFSKFYNKIWFTPKKFINFNDFAKNDINQGIVNKKNNFYLKMLDFDIKNKEIAKNYDDLQTYNKLIDNNFYKNDEILLQNKRLNDSNDNVILKRRLIDYRDNYDILKNINNESLNYNNDILKIKQKFKDFQYELKDKFTDFSYELKDKSENYIYKLKDNLKDSFNYIKDEFERIKKIHTDHFIKKKNEKNRILSEIKDKDLKDKENQEKQDKEIEKNDKEQFLKWRENNDAKKIFNITLKEDLGFTPIKIIYNESSENVLLDHLNHGHDEAYKRMRYLEVYSDPKMFKEWLNNRSDLRFVVSETGALEKISQISNYKDLVKYRIYKNVQDYKDNFEKIKMMNENELDSFIEQIREKNRIEESKIFLVENSPGIIKQEFKNPDNFVKRECEECQVFRDQIMKRINLNFKKREPSLEYFKQVKKYIENFSVKNEYEKTILEKMLSHAYSFDKSEFTKDEINQLERDYYSFFDQIKYKKDNYKNDNKNFLANIEFDRSLLKMDNDFIYRKYGFTSETFNEILNQFLQGVSNYLKDNYREIILHICAILVGMGLRYIIGPLINRIISFLFTDLNAKSFILASFSDKNLFQREVMDKIIYPLLRKLNIIY